MGITVGELQAQALANDANRTITKYLPRLTKALEAIVEAISKAEQPTNKEEK